MEINIKNLGQITVVELSGNIDGKTAPLAQEKILDLAKEDCRILLDMSRVDLMFSAGLRMLLSILRQVPPSGKMILAGLSQQIENTMATAKLLNFFKVSKTFDEAIVSLN